jgi:hypothetical protein
MMVKCFTFCMMASVLRVSWSLRFFAEAIFFWDGKNGHKPSTSRLCRVSPPLPDMNRGPRPRAKHVAGPAGLKCLHCSRQFAQSQGLSVHVKSCRPMLEPQPQRLGKRRRALDSDCEGDNVCMPQAFEIANSPKSRLPPIADHHLFWNSIQGLLLPQSTLMHWTRKLVLLRPKVCSFTLSEHIKWIANAKVVRFG